MTYTIIDKNKIKKYPMKHSSGKSDTRRFT